MPKVSIIMPFHNAAPYLTEAIGSVRAQTLHDWELIIIDDASTDGGHRFAEEAMASDNRIRLLVTGKAAPRGAATARNLGLQAARGEFVAFLDADDLFEPHKLLTEVTSLTQHPEAAMVYGPTRWWYPGAECRDWTEDMGREANRLHPPPSLLCTVLIMQKGRQVPCTCAVMIRKTALDIVGGFHEGFRLYEDQTLWVKLFLRFPVFVSERCVACYRQHFNSVSAEAERQGLYQRFGVHSARLAFLRWIERYVAESGIYSRRISRCLRIAQAPYQTKLNPQVALDKLYLWATAKLRHHMSHVRKITGESSGLGGSSRARKG
jgi:glycosyltransferase involved in cell wall biosynthesis